MNWWGTKEILYRSLYIINKNGLDAFHNNRHHYRLYVCFSMAARCKASVGMGNCSPKTLLSNYITQLTKIPNMNLQSQLAWWYWG